MSVTAQTPTGLSQLGTSQKRSLINLKSVSSYNEIRENFTDILDGAIKKKIPVKEFCALIDRVTINNGDARGTIATLIEQTIKQKDDVKTYFICNQDLVERPNFMDPSTFNYIKNKNLKLKT